MKVVAYQVPMRSNFLNFNAYENLVASFVFVFKQSWNEATKFMWSRI